MNYLKEIKNIIEKDIVNQRKYDIYKSSSLVNTNYNIGRLLVQAQGGKERAKYGDELIKKWSVELTKLYGKNYDYTNLSRMRKFYITFENIATVWQQLTWSNIKTLISIKDESKRNYYINICIKQNLSVRGLNELIKSNAYERLSYIDKSNIEIIEDKKELTITDMIKDPIYIKVPKDKILNEKLLKTLMIEQLEKIFIELGVGFTYAGSEVRLGNSYCDLLFFNYELNSFVVIELKIRRLRKEDVGQIGYYMNYIDKNIKKENHDKTIGLIMCKENNKLVLEYCSNPNIYETTYKLIKKI